MFPGVARERWRTVGASHIATVDLHRGPRSLAAVMTVQGHAQVGAIGKLVKGKLAFPCMACFAASPVILAEQIACMPFAAIHRLAVAPSLDLAQT